MPRVLGDILVTNRVELAEETTARVRVGPSVAFPRVQKDLQMAPGTRAKWTGAWGMRHVFKRLQCLVSPGKGH